MVEKLTKFDIKINHENVLWLIDCTKESKIHKKVLAELEGISDGAYERINPVALLAFGELDGFKLSHYEGVENQALFCIMSIGAKISQWSTQFFKEGDYLKGMLVDAVADDYLFQMSNRIKEPIIKSCKLRNFGVQRRLEAPQDICMSIQKRAWELTNAKVEAGIGIKESFMLDPVKSNCHIYLLKENSQIYNVSHDCSNCSNMTCKLRDKNVYG